MKNDARRKCGQTIVEAIVVIGVVVLLVTGLVAGTTASLRSAQVGRSRNQALKFSEEAIEYARNLRDQKWDAFQVLSGWYCLGGTVPLQMEASGTSTCPLNITTPEGLLFSRSMNFQWDGTKMMVTVSVTYPDNVTVRPITLTTYFTQWK